MTGESLDVFDLFSEGYQKVRQDAMSLRDYLLAARDDEMLYASPAERMVKAIGEPEMIDTSKDPRLARIFFNRTIRQYKAFEGFYGMEDTIERIVSFFRHAGQGLEEKRQILYLLGPVGGGKSSLAERLKDLMEKHPIYVLKAGDEISPVFESPLGLFQSEDLQSLMEDKYGIEKRRLTGLMSPWAVKRLDEYGGDISKFEVVKLYPSKTAPDRCHQNGTGRRKQSGYLRPRRQGRYSQAGAFQPGRHRRLFLFGRSCAAPIRGFLNLSRCSRRRSRFCTRC